MWGGRSWQSSSCQKRFWLKVELLLIYMFPKWVYLELYKAQPCLTYLLCRWYCHYFLEFYKSTSYQRPSSLPPTPANLYQHLWSLHTASCISERNSTRTGEDSPFMVESIHTMIKLWAVQVYGCIWLSLSSSILYNLVLIIPSN